MTDAREVLDALDTVRDPELDEPVTSLGFVTSCTVSPDGVADVRLRLPTYFCAPNFAFLMVADAYEAVSGVAGVRRAQVVLEDHFASVEINRGVAARAGFVAVLRRPCRDGAGRAANGLRAQGRAGRHRPRVSAAARRRDGLRTSSPCSRSATCPSHRTENACARAGPSWACRRATTRRCWWTRVRGEAVGVQALPLHLRRARLTGVSLQANGGVCRGLLRERYATVGLGEEENR